MKINRHYQNYLNNIFQKNALKNKFTFEKIGSDYGGWFIPLELIQSDWICYLGGVGEDTTFDVGLTQRFNCEVFAFDPTPRAALHVRKQGEVAHFHFIELGLWSGPKELRFYAPKNPEHVSHSVTNLQSTETYFTAQCNSIKNIMQELGHNKLDLIKLDIEGAQHEVIKSMLNDKVYPKVICVEFDQPDTIYNMMKTQLKLKFSRYSLCYLDDWNLTFLRNDLLS